MIIILKSLTARRYKDENEKFKEKNKIYFYYLECDWNDFSYNKYQIYGKFQDMQNVNLMF